MASLTDKPCRSICDKSVGYSCDAGKSLLLQQRVVNYILSIGFQRAENHCAPWWSPCLYANLWLGWTYLCESCGCKCNLRVLVACLGKERKDQMRVVKFEIVCHDMKMTPNNGNNRDIWMGYKADSTLCQGITAGYINNGQKYQY